VLPIRLRVHGVLTVAVAAGTLVAETGHSRFQRRSLMSSIDGFLRTTPSTMRKVGAVARNGNDNAFGRPTGAAAGGTCPLHYVNDSSPGIMRKRIGAHFAYFDAKGRRIRKWSKIARIRALAIPPAYTCVWICPDPLGYVQATGRDARGRKQYRYHPAWREIREATKYERMAAFGEALPKIRARVARDLRRPGVPWEKVVATVVRLLDITLVRVGNPKYATENRSYGLTTLRKKHAAVRASRLRFRFRGKSGVEHDVEVNDPRVAGVVRRCLGLPGQELFQFVDDDGSLRPVSSSDINAYLREASAMNFSAKDYRTWAGSVLALRALRRIETQSAAGARKHLVQTVKDVAAVLRNTPAVCRRCYIHPAVVAAFAQGALHDPPQYGSRRGLKADEAVFAALLGRTAEAESRPCGARSTGRARSSQARDIRAL
jgi:DNA topoisomerase I